MTFGMQLRSWLREASRSQVGATLGALAVAVTLVAASVSPSGGDDQVAAGFGGTEQGVDGTAVGAGGDGSAAGDAAATGDAGSTGAGTGRTGTTAAGRSGSAAASGGSGSGAGGGSGTGSGGSGGTGGGGGGGGSTSVKRVASDTGVTADTLTLGVALINVGALKQTGAVVNLREDGEAAVQAMEDDLNERGGIAGRQVKLVSRRVELLVQTDQQSKCTEFLEDLKVFGIIDTATFNFEATQSCITKQHGAPFVHVYALTEQGQLDVKGLDVVSPRNSNRIARVWATEAIEQGFVKAGDAIGILKTDCDPVIDQDLIRILRTVRPSKIVTREVRCLTLSDPSSATADALFMYNEGVTHIFPASGGSHMEQFTKQAEAQLPPGRQRFKYFVSEYLSVTDPNNEYRYDPNQMDGMRGISGVVTFHPPEGTPLPNGVKRCSEILTKHGMPGTSLSARDVEVNALCDLVFMFEKIMPLAGPNPTRQSFAAAVAKTGALDLGINPIASLGPGKYSAADGIADLQWARDCTCFKQVSPFRKGAF